MGANVQELNKNDCVKNRMYRENFYTWKKSTNSFPDTFMKIILILTMLMCIYFIQRCKHLEYELNVVKSECLKVHLELKPNGDILDLIGNEILAKVNVRIETEFSFKNTTFIKNGSLKQASEDTHKKMYASVRKVRQAGNMCFKGEKGEKGDSDTASGNRTLSDPITRVVEIMKGLEASGLRLSDQILITVKGNRGEKGLPGMMGHRTKGNPNMARKGEPGLAGPRGYPGLPGAIQEKCNTGPKGEIGFPGRDGLPGKSGEKGEKGPPGVEGLPGDRWP